MALIKKRSQSQHSLNVQCSFVNLQLFLSTLRTAINTEGDVAGVGADEGCMRDSITSLAATFNELQEVLDRPMMQYAVLNTFLVKAIGRQPLSSRISQVKKVLVEVCSWRG